MMFISVDLPQPLGPKIETILLRGRSRLKLVYSGLPTKLLLRPRTVTWVLGAARSVSSESGSLGMACGGIAASGSAPLMIVAPLHDLLRSSEQSRGRVCHRHRVPVGKHHERSARWAVPGRATCGAAKRSGAARVLTRFVHLIRGDCRRSERGERSGFRDRCEHRSGSACEADRHSSPAGNRPPRRPLHTQDTGRLMPCHSSEPASSRSTRTAGSASSPRPRSPGSSSTSP